MERKICYNETKNKQKKEKIKFPCPNKPDYFWGLTEKKSNEKVHTIFLKSKNQIIFIL